MVPPDHPGENNLIDLVERKFRGTARWFRILSGRGSDRRPRNSPAVTCNQEIAHTLIQKSSFDTLGATCPSCPFLRAHCLEQAAQARAQRVLRTTAQDRKAPATQDKIRRTIFVD